MKKTINLILFLTISFSLSAQWIQQNSDPTGNIILTDIFFIDQSNGWTNGHDNYGWGIGNPGYTNDGGLTWNFPIQYLFTPMNGIYFTDLYSGYGVYDTGTVYKTLDGGLNWMDISFDTEFDLGSIFFMDSITGWTIGLDEQGYQQYYYGIFNTNDGGMSWSSQSFEHAGNFLLGYRYCKVTDIEFLTANLGWAVAGFKLLKTIDGGNNWIEDTVVDFVFTSLHIVNENKLFFTGFNDIQPLNADGVIYFSDDSGETLELVYECESKLLHDISFVDENIGWAVGDSGIILHTSDGGQSWEYQESGTIADLYSIAFVDENFGWICGDSSIILHTNNGGIVNIQEKYGDKLQLSTHPNPFSNEITISTELNACSLLQLSIFDISGKLIFARSMHSGTGNMTLRIDPGIQNKGVYYLRLAMDGKSVTKKIIKM